MTGLPPVPRPDGSLYRPRKVVAHPVGDDDVPSVGVVVFGTADLTRALGLAEAFVAQRVGPEYALVSPRSGWWRSGYCGGQQAWVPDEKRGRFGWYFDIVEQA